MEIKKITFITFHNWDTRCQGGFHKFAEYTCKKGIQTIFFSFSRPYYIRFKHEERLNKSVLKNLTRGIFYTVEKNRLLNITWPTFLPPNCIRNILPQKTNVWLMTHSLVPFKAFSKKWLQDTDCFIFESCDAIFLLDKIKKNFPNAKIIYRPSDPMMLDNVQSYIVNAECNIIQKADLVLVVNEEGLQLYKKNIPSFNTKCHYELLSNGVSIEEYKQKYPIPEPLKHSNTALYIGARDIEWNLILEASIQLPDIYFIIVRPERPTKDILKKIEQQPNISYVNGISPKDVPAWVTNCSLIIVPNPRNWYKTSPWGITAKYYQAMAAKKSIVSFHDSEKLSTIGIHVTYTYAEFIHSIKENIHRGETKYTMNLQEKEWSFICQSFLNSITHLYDR